MANTRTALIFSCRSYDAYLLLKRGRTAKTMEPRRTPAIPATTGHDFWPRGPRGYTRYDYEDLSSLSTDISARPHPAAAHMLKSKSLCRVQKRMQILSFVPDSQSDYKTNVRFFSFFYRNTTLQYQ